jgi:dethiobiotin synthetase
MKGFFVTGTDTEVGKTCVSTGLLHVLAQQGLRVVGLKPVAAGWTQRHGVWAQDDVMALREASTVRLSLLEHGPYSLRTACAPHIAAQHEGLLPQRAALVAQLRHSAKAADAVVVEGAGGFCVPMSPLSEAVRWGLDDLAADLGLPVVLVVALRLGCLNHALLTAQAVAAKGLHLAGWVANQVSPHAMAHQDDNLATLRAWLPAPHLGTLPWLEHPTPASVAAHLDAQALMATLRLKG